jgi:hypothetical protein
MPTSRWVANEWRNTCGETAALTPAPLGGVLPHLPCALPRERRYGRNRHNNWDGAGRMRPKKCGRQGVTANSDQTGHVPTAAAPFVFACSPNLSACRLYTASRGIGAHES